MTRCKTLLVCLIQPVQVHTYFKIITFSLCVSQNDIVLQAKQILLDIKKQMLDVAFQQNV